MERLLNIKQAASLLGIHHLTLRKLISEGEIGHYRLGNRGIRFSEEHIHNFLENRVRPAKEVADESSVKD